MDEIVCECACVSWWDLQIWRKKIEAAAAVRRRRREQRRQQQLSRLCVQQTDGDVVAAGVGGDVEVNFQSEERRGDFIRAAWQLQQQSDCFQVLLLPVSVEAAAAESGCFANEGSTFPRWQGSASSCSDASSLPPWPTTRSSSRNCKC